MTIPGFRKWARGAQKACENNGGGGGGQWKSMPSPPENF